jgi:hypothetical protein
MSTPRLKDKYITAKCCSPSVVDRIIGYFSHDDQIKVHRHTCPNLEKAESDRLVELEWEDILIAESAPPGDDYNNLDALDFGVLKHHLEYDIDYSLMVAKMLQIDRQEAFDRHQKLRNLGLLERVDAVMVRYRKKTARNKWIKHRNHTYYHLTEKGAAYLDFYLTQDR